MLKSVQKRAGAPLLLKQADRVEVAQAEEENVLGRPSSPFQCLKGLRALEKDFVKEQIMMGLCNGFQVKEGRFS